MALRPHCCLTEAGITVLMATHDVDYAYEWADEVILFHEGKVLLHGSPAQVFSNKRVLAQNKPTETQESTVPDKSIAPAVTISKPVFPTGVSPDVSIIHCLSVGGSVFCTPFR